MAQDNTATALDPISGPDADGVSPDASVDPQQTAALAAVGEARSVAGIGDIALLGNIPVNLSMEIGRTSITIKELLSLGKGSVVELQRMADEPLDVLVNGTLVAHGEAVVVGERFGIRLTDVISPSERLGKLG